MLPHRHAVCSVSAQGACATGESPPHLSLHEWDSMSKIKAICVYCGSSPGTDPAFVQTARGFGKILAENGVRLVYGGGSIGLMGALASSVIEHGGAATGIIPEFLTAKERPKRLAQEQIVTRDMHERKQTMFDRADAFVALPGGLGTLEELVEQMTWAQLGRHTKTDSRRQHQRFLGPAACADRSYARAWSRAFTCARHRAPRRRSDRRHPAEAARRRSRSQRGREGNGGPGRAALTITSSLGSTQ